MAKTIKVLGGGAAQGLVEWAQPAFEAANECAIEGSFGPVGGMRDRIVMNGDRTDVVILTRALIDELARDGHVDMASAADIGTVQTGIALREGDTPPRLGNAAALRTALLGADAIHFPDPGQSTAGIHFAKVLNALGIWDLLSDRLRPAPTGATAMHALATSTGLHPIGCTQATEIIATPGLILAGPLPKEYALATVYTAAVGSRTAAKTEAARLVALLASAEARDARRRLGFA